MIRLNYEPLLIFGPLFAVLWAAATGWWRLPGRIHEACRSGLRRACAAAAVCALAGYVSVVIWYGLSSTHLDHIEPSVVSAAYTASRGGALYHGAEARERTAMLYGPMTYLGYGLAMRVLGAHFQVCKLVAATAAVAALLFSWLALKKVVQGHAALLCTGLISAVFLAHAPKSFWVRADPIIILCVSWALFAVVAWPKPAALAGFALACGIAADAKVNAIGHFLPLGIILGLRFGWRLVAVAGAAAVLVGAVWFLIPNASFADWFQVLRLAGRHGFGLDEMRWALQWGAVLAAGLVAGWIVTRTSHGGVALGKSGGVGVENRSRAKQAGARDWLCSGGGAERTEARAVVPDKMLPEAAASGGMLLGIVVSVGLAMVAASKAGSDPTQLLPAVPVIVWAAAGRWRLAASERRRFFKPEPRWFLPLLAANLVTVFALAAYQGYHTARAIRRLEPISQAVDADLRLLIATWGSKPISMGCGSNATEFISSHFATLVLRGYPYVLDPASLMEFEKAGVPLSEATLEMIERGQIPVWLIPRGDAPFSMLNAYPPNRPLFNEDFGRAFAARYRKAASSRFFDVYVFTPR
jgi:hypothetical protein